MARLEQWGHRFERGTESVARSHQNEIQKAAKAGWLAKGALYVTLGVLAVLAAVGAGGAVASSKGVLAWVGSQPFGRLLLVLAGVGFACYALWRFVQAIVDPEPHQSRAAEVGTRIGWAASGIIHGALAVAAFQLAAGRQTSGEGTWLAKAMSAGSWGVALVATLGVAAIGVGLYQFKKAATLPFMSQIDGGRMSDKEWRALRVSARAGYAARGVVLPIIGYFLIVAAINHDPSQAKGIGGALAEVGRAGSVLLAVVAVGLTLYGVLQLFFAKYRRVQLD